jgi:hypothetical protein
MGGRAASLWSSDGKGVEVSDARRERNQFRCIVTIHDEGRAAAAAELDMIGAYQSMMQDFFEELSAANDVEDRRLWDSEFAEVALEFTGAGPQTVRVAADIRPTSDRDEGYEVHFTADLNAVRRWAGDVAKLASAQRV